MCSSQNINYILRSITINQNNILSSIFSHNHTLKRKTSPILLRYPLSSKTIKSLSNSMIEHCHLCLSLIAHRSALYLSILLKIRSKCLKLHSQTNFSLSNRWVSLSVSLLKINASLSLSLKSMSLF